MKVSELFEAQNKKSLSVAEANKFLAKLGYPDLFVHKADGVWYLIGDEGVVNDHIERCLHIVRLSDMTKELLLWKLNELTGKSITESVKYDPSKHKSLASTTDKDGYRIEIHNYVDTQLPERFLDKENELGYPLRRAGTMFVFNPKGEWVKAGYWMNFPEPEWKLSKHQWFKMPMKKRAQMETDWQSKAYKPLKHGFEFHKARP